MKLTQHAIDHPVDAVFYMTEEGRFLYANLQACKRLNYSNDELLGMGLHDIDSNIRKSGFPEYWEAVKKKGLDINESVHITKDGKQIPVEVSSSYSELDGKAYIYAFVRDITERKKLEAQLWQAQKMEGIGVLAGGIAHDFNNILSIIMSSAEMMKRQDLNGNDTAKKRLERIFTASKRGEKLVHQILSFIRSDEQKKSVITLNHKIRETLNFLSSTLPATITIKEQIHNQPLKILGNPTQINQLLVNLCTNAKHAMEGRKGVLGINLGHVVIDHSANYKGQPVAQGRYVLLSVTDTGHGIDPTVIDRIFDPFFTTKSKEEGTGLGLAMVHKIVKDHGGQVIVESQCGKGSEFHAVLPLYEGSENRVGQSQKVIPKGILAVNSGKKRILLVDDEQDVANAWKALLESVGYEVTSKTSGIDALKVFQSQPDRFDLVITDNNMPHMSGNEVARSMLKIREDLPIIFCSGTINEKVQEEFINLPNVLFLSKPVSLELLNNKICQLIDAGMPMNSPSSKL